MKCKSFSTLKKVVAGRVFPPAVVFTLSGNIVPTTIWCQEYYFSILLHIQYLLVLEGCSALRDIPYDLLKLWTYTDRVSDGEANRAGTG